MNINKYPYTDFHELNLDWFLAQFKTLTDAWDSQQADYNKFKEDVTTEFNNLSGKFDTLEETVQSFTRFITNYFDNLDVQEEINTKLNEMVSDGTMAELLAPVVTAQVPGAVTTWLNANVNPVGSAVVVDKSLTVSGAAADAKVTGDELAKRIKYPSKEVNVPFTQARGIISTSLSVYDTGESYPGRYTSIDVNPGEVYTINCHSTNNTYPGAFVIKSDNTAIIILGSSSDVDYVDKTITIPADAVKLYINGSITHTQIAIKTTTTMAQSAIEKILTNSAAHKMKCKLTGSDLMIKKKYNSTSDIVIEFDHVGGNNLFNFKSIFLIPNTDSIPNDDFDRSHAIDTWNASVSDWIGPYKVAAVNNIDGDNPASNYFTGGNHRTTNTSVGGGVTATEIALTFAADKMPISDDIITGCDEVIIKWTNLVQAFNTSKADGSGRGVLTETWTFTINEDIIKVHNNIEALEEVTLITYYGLQATASGMSFRYYGGANREVYAASDSIVSGNNTCRIVNIFNTNFNMEMSIDPIGLGLLTNNAGSSFTNSSSKLYVYLVNQMHPVSMAANEHYDVEGSYIFKA